AAVIHLVREIRERKVDIIHTHLVRAGIVGKLAASIVRVPVVTTRHYTRDAKSRRWDFVAEDVLTRLLADRVIAIGDSVFDTIREQKMCAPEKIVLHRNAIDVASYVCQGRDERTPNLVIGTVGRLHPAKAHEVFLDALAMVRRTHPEVTGVIVGGGERLVALKEYADRCGVLDAVTFTGAVDSDTVRDWLHRFDIFVLPSDWEGLPISLIEAAAAGLPIVATDVGGCPEVVRDGENGFLVPPRDPAAVANAVERLIRDVSLRDAFGNRAVEIAKSEFDIHRLADQTADLYREIRMRKACT
ncbi:MAG TPA: glycosyltransferase family 1 protein, partial [Firmicutes bacterium]|nr:glycosyltransferase family 1 protein [Bacillota bacterium]